MKTGELKIVCKKKVSNIDWCEAAIKNFLPEIIFSLPLIIILVDKNVFKHRDVQKPMIFPPYKTIFFGNKIEGKKINEIKIIPEKKNNENIKFLIILIKN